MTYYIADWPARHVLHRQRQYISADMSTMKPSLSVKDIDLETDRFVQSIEMYIRWCRWGSPKSAKLQNPCKNLSGRKVTGSEEDRRREKMLLTPMGVLTPTNKFSPFQAILFDPWFFLRGWNPNIFFELGAHSKFHDPKTAPSGRKVTESEEHLNKKCVR